MKYPYGVLGVAEDAPQEEIRQAYLERLRKFPPEQAPERFQEVRDAWRLLENDLDRARLAVFGLPLQNAGELTLTDLLPDADSLPRRPGTAFWRNLFAAMEKEHD